MNLNKLTAAQREQIAASNNKSGFLYHLNGSVDAINTNITLAEYSNQFIIYNTHASNTLYVSFDSGVNWFNIPYGSTLSVDTCTVKVITLKGSSSATTYQILYNY